MVDAFYPLDDQHGYTAGPGAGTGLNGNLCVESGGHYPGTYIVDQVSGYYQGQIPNYYPAPTPLRFRQPAPAISGYGVQMLVYANGDQWYSGAFSAPRMTAYGNSNAVGRAPFTISLLLKLDGTGQPDGQNTLARGYVGAFGNVVTGTSWGIVMGTGYEPLKMAFYRYSGAGYNSGNPGAYSQVTATNLDWPSVTTQDTIDDWGGRSYIEYGKAPVWAALVCRYDGYRKSIWIDGIKVGEDTVDDTLSLTDIYLGGAVTLGGRANTGTYAELAQFGRALDDSEITG